MFLNILEKNRKEVHPRAKQLLDEGLELVYGVDPKEAYLNKVRDSDIGFVSYLLIRRLVDVNYRFRMDPRHRTNGDLVPLKMALENYAFDMAELLIKFGHYTDDIVIKLNKRDQLSMYNASYKELINFCESHNIKYEEIDYEE